MLQFIHVWNEFYFALMLTSGDRARTVPIALNYYMSTFANDYSALFAAVIVTIIPTIVFFVFMQKQVIDSLTSGAVKG
jgi:raffinose/stachyose/melibiose transport system permease protein